METQLPQGHDDPDAALQARQHTHHCIKCKTPQNFDTPMLHLPVVRSQPLSHTMSSNTTDPNTSTRPTLTQTASSSSSNLSIKNNTANSTTTEDIQFDKSMETLTAMGFSEDLAESALILADGDLQRASDLLLTLPAEEIMRRVENDYETDESDDVPEKEYKMQLLVRTDLAMGKGKIAAQCCHGALGVYRMIQSSSNDTWKRNLAEWERIAEAKVVLKVTSEQMLMEYYDKAMKAGLPAVFIEDAGRTQIEPGSKTVVAIGPCPEEDFAFTRPLKLL